MYDRFKKLCEKHGKSMKEVCDVIGIKPSAVSNWKKRGSLPNGDTCLKISKYFGVSVDYLMTGQEPAPDDDVLMDIPRFTDGEMKLLEVFKKLSVEKQDEVINYGLFLLSKQNDELKKSSPSSKEA